MRVPKAPTTDRRPNVTAHSYNAATKTLEVTFHGGARYRYHEVSARTATHFGKAESRGEFLHSHIIPHHRAEKLPPEKS